MVRLQQDNSRHVCYDRLTQVQQIAVAIHTTPTSEGNTNIWRMKLFFSHPTHQPATKIPQEPLLVHQLLSPLILALRRQRLVPS